MSPEYPAKQHCLTPLNSVYRIRQGASASHQGLRQDHSKQLGAVVGLIRATGKSVIVSAVNELLRIK